MDFLDLRLTIFFGTVFQPKGASEWGMGPLPTYTRVARAPSGVVGVRPASAACQSAGPWDVTSA